MSRRHCVVLVAGWKLAKKWLVDVGRRNDVKMTRNTGDDIGWSLVLDLNIETISFVYSGGTKETANL